MTASIQFDWDIVKAAANLRKHGVSFEQAMLVFDDRLALSVPDPSPVSDEERWITIGLAGSELLILVVHTHIDIDENSVYVRIISARKPTLKEKKQYENGEA